LMLKLILMLILMLPHDKINTIEPTWLSLSTVCLSIYLSVQMLTVQYKLQNKKYKVALFPLILNISPSDGFSTTHWRRCAKFGSWKQAETPWSPSCSRESIINAAHNER
jgi:hypothetical protein